MTEEPKRNGVDLSLWGGHLVAQGPLTVFVLCTLALVGAIIFTNWHSEVIYSGLHAQTRGLISSALRQQQREHELMIRTQNIVVCMGQLSPDEKAGLRRNFSSRALDILCPWIGIQTGADVKATP